MSFLKEFHYSNISQRKILDYSVFLSFLILSIFITDVYFVLKYYSFYSPAVKIIIIISISGLFFGNILGRFLFVKKDSFRPLYIFSEAMFIIFFLLYTLRNLFMPESREFFIALFFSCKYSIPVLLFAMLIFFGIKFNYSIRVSCGNLIDTKQGIVRLIGFMILGLSAGIILCGVLYSFAIPLFCTIPLALMLAPSVFLMNLPYSPASFYANDFEEEKDHDASSQNVKGGDAAFFSYLNFLFIIIYAYLGFASISRYYGDLLYVTQAFMAMLFISLIIGFGAGRFIKVPKLHVYGESFFPVIFLLFLILLMSFNRQLNFISGIMLFSPMAVLLGIVLSHTISAVIQRYDNFKRATIVEFSLLIVPAPVLVSLCLISLTNLWFYIIMGAVMIINVVVPAISIINTDISGYKKGLYFLFSLFFLPVFIFIILFFRISLDNNVYVTRVDNFEELRTVNYNADYIRNQATVTMNSLPVFAVSDSVVRNLKRSLVPVALYHPVGKKILFIDGNQKFFRNPVIGFFKYALCIDMLSDRDVDYNRLPISGTQKYIPDNSPVIWYVEKNKTSFFTVVDIPNLLDQAMNAFRFSDEYYHILKKRLERNGVFVQVFNVPGCRPEFLASALTGLRRSFSSHAIYYFSNVLIVVASDDSGALRIDQKKYEQLITFYNSHGELNGIFMNEPHVCSHLMSTKIDYLLPAVSRERFFPGLYLAEADRFRFKKPFIDDYVANNKKIFEQIDRSTGDQAFMQAVAASFQNDDAIMSLLKKTELAEAREDYREETTLLFELKKQAEFRITLQSYVRKMLAYKEKYYYSAALNLEKNKKWTEAQELYRTVLTINPDNFNANYRMALVSITLQDIEGSFNYLQQAMRINKDHPKVLMQMGILYFSSGKTEEAIEYLTKALQQNEKTPQIYRYLGMCHEKTGNLNEAERYYAKAIGADPNDVDTRARLDEVRVQIDKDSKKWDAPEQKNESDVEQDAEMPLPVSKGAYEIRLKDDDMTLPVIDPVTGEEIQNDEDTGGTQNRQPQDNKPQAAELEKK